MCCIGEVGAVSRLIPRSMRAAQSVVVVVMGDDEVAMEKIDSDELWYKSCESGNPMALAKARAGTQNGLPSRKSHLPYGAMV